MGKLQEGANPLPLLGRHVSLSLGNIVDKLSRSCPCSSEHTLDPVHCADRRSHSPHQAALPMRTFRKRIRLAPEL